MLAILSIMIIAVMTPGPDFAIVTQNTLFHGRKIGFFTGLGIAMSNVFHTTYSVLGLTYLMMKSAFVFNIVKYLGAAYLLYLGFKALRAQRETVEANQQQMRGISSLRAFWQGFLCNALNPKAALLFVALFTLFLKPETSVYAKIGVGSLLVLINLVWYTIVSSILGTKRIRRTLSQFQYWMTKLLGVAFVGFGVKLALAERE